MISNSGGKREAYLPLHALSVLARRRWRRPWLWLRRKCECTQKWHILSFFRTVFSSQNCTFTSPLISSGRLLTSNSIAPPCSTWKTSCTFRESYTRLNRCVHCVQPTMFGFASSAAPKSSRGTAVTIFSTTYGSHPPKRSKVGHPRIARRVTRSTGRGHANARHSSGIRAANAGEKAETLPAPRISDDADVSERPRTSVLLSSRLPAAIAGPIAAAITGGAVDVRAAPSAAGEPPPASPLPRSAAESRSRASRTCAAVPALARSRSPATAAAGIGRPAEGSAPEPSPPAASGAARWPWWAAYHRVYRFWLGIVTPSPSEVRMPPK